MKNKIIYSIIQKYKKQVINFLVTMTFRVIPVPIPNTEVKPKCAENTCGLPCWKDRLSPDFFYYQESYLLYMKIKDFAIQQKLILYKFAKVNLTD